MSINWVMLDTGSKSFVPLPREKILFTSPNRTSLALQTPNSYPGKEPLAIKCSDGKAIITNQRLIYLPTNPTPSLQSFQSPLLSLNDTHVSAPFFGPNVWEGLLIPTSGGGIPAHHQLVQIKLTFREGGAFDFSSTFERIKETLSQASDMARENGRTLQPGETDLEQLPAYEEALGSAARGRTVVTPSRTTHPAPMPDREYQDEKSASTPATAAAPGPSVYRPTPVSKNRNQNQQPPLPPNEPPPGYDEANENSIADNLERQARDE